MTKTLGRGLSSLIPNAKDQNQPVDLSGVDTSSSWLKDSSKQILEVSPDKISANPYQPRKNFVSESLADLKESIKEHGILQPLVVTEKADPSTGLSTGMYELVAGERRLRASQEIHLKTVPIIVRSAGELEKLELSLIENIQRQDLNAIERAEAYKRLVDEFSLTHEQAAKRMGKSRPVISNTLRLLDLPAEVQKMIGEGRLNETAALAVLELDDQEKQLDLALAIATEKLTKNEARRRAHKLKGKPNRSTKHKGDPVLKGFEADLESKLQTRVRIGHRGKGFIIEVEAYSREELEDVIGKILSKY